MPRTESLFGKVQTVLGLIKPEDLGVTLMHEHLLIDQSCGGVYFSEPERGKPKGTSPPTGDFGEPQLGSL